MQGESALPVVIFSTAGPRPGGCRVLRFSEEIMLLLLDDGGGTFAELPKAVREIESDLASAMVSLH